MTEGGGGGKNKPLHVEMPRCTSGQNPYLFFSTISAGVIKRSSLPMESKNTFTDESPPEKRRGDS